MATIEYAKDTSVSVNSDGITRVREKLIEAESIEELLASNLIPQYGSRHPENTRFRLTDGNVEQIGNMNGTCQFLFSGTYSSSRGRGAEAGNSNSDLDPWELDAQDFSKQKFALNVPVFNLIDQTGKKIPFFNSANCRLQAQRDVYGTEYAFIFCVKYKLSSEPKLPGQPIVNSETVKVAGETLPAYSSLLFPPQMRLITDRDDEGNLMRSYWEISCQIQKHPFENGWFEKYPDVGTLALDHTGRPAPIYRFVPWTNTGEENKLRTIPDYGTIQEVIAAKHLYASLDSKIQKYSTEYWQAWQELPYEEVTEPMPLKDGKVYKEALFDPQQHPYKQIVGTTFNLGKFQQFNLPMKREG